MKKTPILACILFLALSCLASRGQSLDRSRFPALVPAQTSDPLSLSSFPEKQHAPGILAGKNGFIKKKKTYFQNLWVMLSQFSLSLVNNVSVTAGMVPLFLYPGSPSPVILIPKVTVPLIREKWLVSAGVLIGKMAGNNQSGFTVAYGTTTFGNPGTYISLGVGFGSLSGSWAEEPVRCFRPLAESNRKPLPGDDGFRFTRSNSLLMISIGGRKSLKKAGIDFGIFIPVFQGQNFLVIYPWIGISIPLYQQNLRMK
jgi:hypothetical protein